MRRVCWEGIHVVSTLVLKIGYLEKPLDPLNPLDPRPSTYLKKSFCLFI